MTGNREPRLQSGYDYLAASLTNDPMARENRAMLRRYLDHFDTPPNDDDTSADRVERLSAFCQLLAGAAYAGKRP